MLHGVGPWPRLVYRLARLGSSLVVGWVFSCCCCCILSPTSPLPDVSLIVRRGLLSVPRHSVGYKIDRGVSLHAKLVVYKQWFRIGDDHVLSVCPAARTYDPYMACAAPHADTCYGHLARCTRGCIVQISCPVLTAASHGSCCCPHAAQTKAPAAPGSLPVWLPSMPYPPCEYLPKHRNLRLGTCPIHESIYGSRSTRSYSRQTH